MTSSNKGDFNIDQMTLFTIWITPLLAKISVLTTFACADDVSTVTPYFDERRVISSPPIVFTVVLPCGISLAKVVVGNTCLIRSSPNDCTLSGSNNVANLSEWPLLKASLFGAKTVKVPGPSKVSAKPDILRAIEIVDNSSLSLTN